jgi:N-acetylglucosaminyl-diphospho-decaprenol L-rhamnosyltransferase
MRGGFGRAVNAGLAHAFADEGVDACVVLNSDGRLLSPPCVDCQTSLIAGNTPLLAIPQRDQSHGLTVAVKVFGRSGLTRNIRVEKLRSCGPLPQKWDLQGGAFAINRHLFENLSGLDERGFLYFEDVDLSRRTRRLGAHVSLCAHALVDHQQGGVLDSMSAESVVVRRYHMAYSRVMYAKDWRWLGPVGASATSLAFAARDLLTGRCRAARYGIRGAADGLRALPPELPESISTRSSGHAVRRQVA